MNVPWHILAPQAVACDMFLLRASALMGTLVPFCVIGNFKEFPITQKKEACRKADLLKFASISPGS